MSNELDEVSKSLFNGQIPGIWRSLAPATLKNLGNWMIHLLKRYDQYNDWVSWLILFSFVFILLCHVVLSMLV